VLIVLCPGIACLVGIFRAISGGPTGGKMIGYAFLSGIIQMAIRFALVAATHQ
jgi:hypothetical protein